MNDPRAATADSGLVPWRKARELFNARHGVSLSRNRVYQIAMDAESKLQKALADDPLVRDLLGKDLDHV